MRVIISIFLGFLLLFAKALALENREATSLVDQASYLNLAVHDLTKQLLRHGAFPKQYTVGVATLVNLNRLDLTTPLGRLLSEMLMGELQRAGLRVVELRLTNEILVQKGLGELSLSRLAKDLADSVNLNAVLVGTYLVRGRYIFVNVRLVSKKDNRILSSGLKVLPLNPLLSALLYPPAGPPDPTVRVPIRDF